MQSEYQNVRALRVSSNIPKDREGTRNITSLFLRRCCVDFTILQGYLDIVNRGSMSHCILSHLHVLRMNR